MDCRYVCSFVRLFVRSFACLLDWLIVLFLISIFHFCCCCCFLLFADVWCSFVLAVRARCSCVLFAVRVSCRLLVLSSLVIFVVRVWYSFVFDGWPWLLSVLTFRACCLLFVTDFCADFSYCLLWSTSWFVFGGCSFVLAGRDCCPCLLFVCSAWCSCLLLVQTYRVVFSCCLLMLSSRVVFSH